MYRQNPILPGTCNPLLLSRYGVRPPTPGPHYVIYTCTCELQVHYLHILCVKALVVCIEGPRPYLEGIVKSVVEYQP